MVDLIVVGLAEHTRKMLSCGEAELRAGRWHQTLTQFQTFLLICNYTFMELLRTVPGLFPSRHGGGGESTLGEERGKGILKRERVRHLGDWKASMEGRERRHPGERWEYTIIEEGRRKNILREGGCGRGKHWGGTSRFHCRGRKGWGILGIG